MADKKLGRIQRINILINESLNQELSQAARKSGVTKSALVRVALERELSRDKQLESEIASREVQLS